MNFIYRLLRRADMKLWKREINVHSIKNEERELNFVHLKVSWCRSAFQLHWWLVCANQGNTEIFPIFISRQYKMLTTSNGILSSAAFSMAPSRWIIDCFSPLLMLDVKHVFFFLIHPYNPFSLSTIMCKKNSNATSLYLDEKHVSDARNGEFGFDGWSNWIHDDPHANVRDANHLFTSPATWILS